MTIMMLMITTVVRAEGTSKRKREIERWEEREKKTGRRSFSLSITVGAIKITDTLENAGDNVNRSYE